MNGRAWIGGGGPVLVVVTLALATCLSIGAALAADPAASPSTSPSPTIPTTLTVEGAWARVSPMVDRAGAAYMIIRSSATTDDALVKVTSPAASVVEMHQTTADPSGMMVMQPVPEIPVPADGMVALAPGGYHLMLIDLVAPLVDGTDMELTLTFRSGAVLAVHALVGTGAPTGSPSPMATMAPMGSRAPLMSTAPAASMMP